MDATVNPMSIVTWNGAETGETPARPRRVKPASAMEPGAALSTRAGRSSEPSGPSLLTAINLAIRPVQTGKPTRIRRKPAIPVGEGMARLLAAVYRAGLEAWTRDGGLPARQNFTRSRDMRASPQPSVLVKWRASEMRGHNSDGMESGPTALIE